MAKVIESFKQKTVNGLSDEYVFGAAAENILFEDGTTLQDKIDNMDQDRYNPISHANSNGDIYGRGDKDVYGHVKLSDAINSDLGESGGTAATPKSVSTRSPFTHRYDNNGAINTDSCKGTSTYYGHVKLSNATDSTSGTDNGIAATPKAVKDAMDAVKAMTYTMTLNGTTLTITSNNT